MVSKFHFLFSFISSCLLCSGLISCVSCVGVVGVLGFLVLTSSSGFIVDNFLMISPILVFGFSGSSCFVFLLVVSWLFACLVFLLLLFLSCVSKAV